MDQRVFISYSSLDKTVASTICRAIEGRGHPCWIASRDVHPGDNFQESIVQAIRQCRVMLLVFSKNANGSREIQKELALAGQFERLVIPVRVEDVQPSDAFRFELATRQWVDIFEDWESAIERLVKRIEAIVPIEERDGTKDDPPGPIDLDENSDDDRDRRFKKEDRKKDDRKKDDDKKDDDKKAAPLGLWAGAALLLLAAATSGFYFLRAPDKNPQVDASVQTSAPVKNTAALPQGGADVASAAKPAEPQKEQPNVPSGATQQTPKPDNAVVVVQGSASQGSLEAPVTNASSSQTAKAAQTASVAEDKLPIGPPGSRPAPGSRFRECTDCPEMAVIPAGRFLMGSPPTEAGRSSNEGPVREVAIPAPLAIGRFAVTFAEFDACVAEGGCEHYTPGDSGWGRGQLPVIFVTWRHAQAYVQWLSAKTNARYRLLSEAEWEYAARACADRGCLSQPFWLGSRIGPADANYDWSKSFDGSLTAAPLRRTVAVDWGKPNAFGLFNMVGNLRQWVEDCWRPDYAGLSQDSAPVAAPGCQSHVVRGASWSDDPRALRSAARSWETIEQRSRQIGFRVARQLE